MERYKNVDFGDPSQVLAVTDLQRRERDGMLDRFDKIIGTETELAKRAGGGPVRQFLGEEALTGAEVVDMPHPNKVEQPRENAA